MTTLRPFEEESTRELDFVGKPTVRVDGLEKVSGAARYVDDMDFGPDLLHAEIVESPHANAMIMGIDTSAAEAVPGVTKVVTGKDFPYKFGLYMKDRYIFAQDRVRFVGEQVAAVVARDPKVAKRAAKLVDVTYEVLRPIFDPIEALKPDTELIHPDLGDYTHVPWFLPPRRHEHRSLAQDPQGRCRAGLCRGGSGVGRRVHGAEVRPLRHRAACDRRALRPVGASHHVVGLAVALYPAPSFR